MDELRLITEPTVTVVCRPAFDYDAMHGHLRASGLEWPDLSAGWVWAESGDQPESDSDGQRVIEAGGRVCYRSWAGGRPHAEHVRHLVEVRHFSVLEHAVYTLHVAGISRSCSHELVRHRHLSPSQESQRYVDATDVAFVVPPALLAAKRASDGEFVSGPGGGANDAEFAAADAFHWFEHSCKGGLRAYRELSDYFDSVGLPRKQAREAARSVLPNAAETRMQLTGNLRAWVEACLKRCSEAADAEIRRLFCRVFALLAAECPDVFAGFDRTPLPDGTFALRLTGGG